VGTRQVEVDLGKVPFMDSTGISALVDAYNDVSGTGADLRLRNPQAIVRQVLQMTNLYHLLMHGVQPPPPDTGWALARQDSARRFPTLP